MNVTGHFWTIFPTVRHTLAPTNAPAALPWSTELSDPERGTITLGGDLRPVPGARACLVLVHGLGGTTGSFYNVAAAQAAEAAGVSCLRISLRGADRRGEDFYHGGLVEDLQAALASEALAHYEDLFIMGFSLGGHMTLRFALAPSDPRVRAVAAICPPLDLAKCADAIDRPRAFVYRRAVLNGLKEIYEAVAQRKSVPTPLQRVRAIQYLREWDRLTVAPRYGFASEDDYYRRMSVGPRLRELAVPTLVVHSRRDPMIPPATYAHLQTGSSPNLTWLHVDDGGHVAFPERVNLHLNGTGDGVSVEAQALHFLLRSTNS